MENNKREKPANGNGRGAKYRFLYFSELIKRPVCAGKIKNRIGKLNDIVFTVKDQYPEAVGLYLNTAGASRPFSLPGKKLSR